MTTAASTNTQKTLNITGAVVAVLLVLILAAGIGSLVKVDIPQNNHDILLVLITAVATNVGQIISFFFGSSSGAKAKDDAIQTLSNTAAAAQAALVPVSSPDNKNVQIEPGQTAKFSATEPPTQ